jgi:hypothetical protein
MRGTRQAVGRTLSTDAGTHCRMGASNKEACVDATVLGLRDRKGNRLRHARL